MAIKTKPAYRVLGLSPNKAHTHPDAIHPTQCMVEKLRNKALKYGRGKTYQGIRFYALYGELLDSTWLKPIVDTIQADKSGSQFLVIERTNNAT